MKDEIELNLINRMIDCAITKTGSISQSNDVTFYYNDLEKLMNDYANKRVIEELEKLIFVLRDNRFILSVDLINRIEELKQ